MKKANYHQKGLVCNILEHAFVNVPGICWVIGKDTDNHHKLKKLINIAVELTFLQGEVYLSDNEKGALLFFRQHERKINWEVLKLYAQLAFHVIGFSRIPEILQREIYIQKTRSIYQGKYLYVWFIGAETDAEMSAVVDLKNGIFNVSLQENLPIFMETTVPKAKLAYTRYGFEIFHEWYNQQREITVWFFRRNPSQLGITA